MALDFNDLIPSTVVKEKPGEKQRPAYDDLIRRQIAPKAGAMNFEDLVPQRDRVAFPGTTPELLDAARTALSDMPLPVKTIPSVDIGEVGRFVERPPEVRRPDLRRPEARKAGKPPIGIREQARRMDWAERIPFSPVGLFKQEQLLEAVNRLRGFDYETYAASVSPTKIIPQAGLPKGMAGYEMVRVTPQELRDVDKSLIENYLIKLNEEQERGLTFGAKVLTGASYLPAWMVEFVLTGGLKTLGSKAAEKAGAKLLGRYAKTKAGQAAIRTSRWLAGAAVRTTVGMPHRVGEEILKRRIPPRMHFGPNQEFVIDIKPEEGWATSVAKGWGNVFIEAASEEAGATITKGLSAAVSKLPFGRGFLAALRKTWGKLKPGNNAWAFWQKIFKKGGYSNIIGEIGEERLATIMHGIANTQHFGAGKDAGMFDRLAAGFTEDVKNFPVEAAVLSLPAATRFTLARATEPFIREPVKPPPTPAESPQQIYDRVVSQWGEDAVDKAQAFLADQDETYKDIEGKFVDLDSEGKGETPEAQNLERRLMKMAETYLKEQRLAVPEKPREVERPAPVVPEKPAAEIERVEPVPVEPEAKEVVKPAEKPVQAGDTFIDGTGRRNTIVAPAYNEATGERIPNNWIIQREGESTPEIQPRQVLPWQLEKAEPEGVTGMAYLLDDGTVLKDQGAASHINLAQKIPKGKKVVDAGFLDSKGNYLMRDEVISKGKTYSFVEPDGTVVQAKIVEDDVSPEMLMDGIRIEIPDGKFSIEREQLLKPVEEQFADRLEQWEARKSLSTHKMIQREFTEPKPVLKVSPAKPAVEPEPVAEVKPRAVEIMPRKTEILAEIKEAIARAPSETELRTRLQKEIPEPATTLPTEEWQRDVQAKAKKIAEAVDKIKSERVKFDIDGGANIINTKEALQTFYNQVSKLKERETIPRRLTPKARGVGKPVAAKKEQIGPLYKAPEGYFTDGRIVVKGRPPAKARYDEAGRSVEQQFIDEVLNNPTEPARLQHYAYSAEEGKGISARPVPGAEWESFAVFKSEGKYYVYPQKKFNVIRNRYPDAQYGIYPKSGQLTAYDNSKPVAALAPIETDEGPARDKPPVEISGLEREQLAPSLFEPERIDFEDLVPSPVEAEHISNIVVKEFRKWPEGIKRVGKDYWTEVMAVAKSFMTPLRYKALRQTMLGAFRYKKGITPQAVGIEVQDVRDALTGTHELAHDIDWLMNNNKFPSSIKARFADPEAKESKLRAELKKVSRVIRPDLWRSPKKRKYVSSHPELMADYISHYILDPEAVRELAPTVTPLFEKRLAQNPRLADTVSRLQEVRYEGPIEPPIAEHIRETFPLPKEFTPLQLIVDMTNESYVKAAEELGITAARHYKLLMQRAKRDAERIDELVPNKTRQTDLVVIAENGDKNPWTGKTRQQILREGLKPNEKKAISLFRAYQELARQTVDKYLRGADIAEYIKFIDDYFVHAYQTPMTEKYKTAISRWAKRSPQAKKRVLPDLAKAVELGLKPRAKTLSEGLTLWAGINYRVATNKAFLRILPKITNEDGVSILQKPQDFPAWPTVDYWPIRQTYAVPLPGRGVLLFQGRIAIDPKVKPFIDAMFGRRAFNTPVRIIEGFNAITKACELTLFSFFHHQAEFFSAAGSLGPRALPFVGGYYGKRAQAFGKKPRLGGLLPAHIGVLKAGKQLAKSPEFMDDYLAHGGQVGYISTEGINLMERMLKSAADYLKNMTQVRPIRALTPVFAAAYVPVKTAQAAYSFHQRLLWDNVQRAKLVSYYNIVADGAKHSDLPIKKVKETAAKYIADNYGGQEWLNTMFRKPKTRQFWTQLMMSLDWTWSQIKTARWPFAYGGKTKQEQARRALMRKIGMHHWFWYLSAVAGFTIAGNYAMSGKGPWENELYHKLDIDWTKIWRALPWNRDWKQRGDYSRRYIGVGKAGRELVRWVTHPLKAFGYKLSPGARTLFEQTTGYNIGSDFPETWAREDLEWYNEVYARFGNVMEKFKPYSLSGNNAFLAFPSRRGMTHWKAIRSFEEIFNIRANIASGGLTGRLTKASLIIHKDRKRLVEEINAACKLNNVDPVMAASAALTKVRSRNYSRFWYAAKKQDVRGCDRYANVLLALGVTEQGFIQSMMARNGRRISEQALKMGMDIFLKKQSSLTK